MSDYLALARNAAARLMDSRRGTEIQRRDGEDDARRVTAYATLAVAEALAALTPPQGATGAAPDLRDASSGIDATSSGSRPAEPSLVALDHYDELRGECRRWAVAFRIFPPDSRDSLDASGRLLDVIDRIELAR